MFVSNFTDLGHEKLRKLYKRTASKIRDSEPAEVVMTSLFVFIFRLQCLAQQCLWCPLNLGADQLFCF